MGHNDILPGCAADLATLRTTQKTLGDDMKDLKDDVKELTSCVEKVRFQLDDIVIPAIKTLPELIQQPAEQCPVYRAFKDAQEKAIQHAFNEEKKTGEIRNSVKVNDNWLQKIVANKIVQAIAALVAAGAAASVAYLNGAV